jgi:ribokinase
MSPRITVVGSLNIDLVAQTRRMPLPGETISGYSFCTALGGKGANQAVAAVRLGAQVAMVGRVGADDFGRMQRQALESLAIETNLLITDEGQATGTALIIVDAEGQNTIVVISGANGRLSPSDVDASRSTIAASDALLLQLENPIATVDYAAEVAHALGVPVVLNPAPSPEALVPASLLRNADYLIPNELEASALTGIAVTGQDSAEIAAAALRSAGVETVVITLGARGAVAVSSKGTIYVPAFPVNAVDTTAAGDAFVAAFSVATCEGQPLSETLLFASAAGALAATRLGAQPSLPLRKDVDAYLRRRDGAHGKADSGLRS